MKKTVKAIVITLAVVLIVLTVFALFYLRNGIVIVDGERISGVKVSSRFYSKGMYTTLPVAATLSHLGYEVFQQDENTFILNSYPFSLVMDIDQLTLTVNGSTDNFFEPVSEDDYFYCERKGNDVIVDESTLQLILVCTGEYEIAGTIPLLKLVVFREPAIHWAAPPYVEESYIPAP